MKRKLMFLIALTLTISALLVTQPTKAFVCDSNTLQGNCVLYARSQVPSLPTGLTYYQAKLNIINHRFPTVGSVAVMPAPGTLAQYGHVAVVRSVAIRTDGTLQLTVQESNYGDCAISTRTVTPESRSIQGYFDPRYPSGQSSPKLDSALPSSGTAGQQFYVTATGTGFEASSAQGMILGGWCNSFGKCSIPNNVMPIKSSTSLKIPITLSSPGKYMLYIFNSASGKTSNGKPITIN
jgi:hypothetical protein